jgi:peptidoglycan/LPS O-acetylase OafA/YrhL
VNGQHAALVGREPTIPAASDSIFVLDVDPSLDFVHPAGILFVTHMNRSILLDILRILAIALVFVAHVGQLANNSAGDFFGLKNFYYVSFGGVGVSLFLVLSGVLAGLRGAPPRTGYATYMLKRALRIYPLYLMSVPLAVLGYILGGLLMEESIPKLFPNGFVTDMVGSITGFYSWMGLWGGPYNSPSWFIALIMTMYALFPMIYFFMKKQRHLAIVVLLIVSLASRYYIGQEGIPFVDTTLWEDVKGWFYRKYGFMPGRPGDWFPPCRLFEFGLGVYLALLLPRAAWFAFQTRFRRPIQFLSELAFPIFLTHYPFLFLVVYLEETGLPLALSVFAFLALIIFVSYLVYLIDQRVPREQMMSLLQNVGDLKR